MNNLEMQGHDSYIVCAIENLIIKVQSTLALRTPRYYGHLLLRKKSISPAEDRGLTGNDSRYYGLTFAGMAGIYLRTLSRYQNNNFIVLTLDKELLR